MTPADLLAPQPPTVPGEDQRAVWGLIVADLEGGRYLASSVPLALLHICRGRDAQGAKKYGHRLPVDSGRNSRVDELQEALDGMAYSRQTYEQELRAYHHVCEYAPWGAENLHLVLADAAWARHLRCLQTVVELLEELS